MDTHAQIAELHSEYVRLTGRQISLNMHWEYVWLQWINWRRDKPFTADDLRLVVEHLRRGIKAGDRNPGCLKLANLIGNPDYFEEDLATARQAARPRYAPAPRVVRTKTADGQTTERRLTNPGHEDTSKRAAEVLESQAFKDFVKLKETLK